eukprot:2957344-Amphidinium_carterae.1
MDAMQAAVVAAAKKVDAYEEDTSAVESAPNANTERFHETVKAASKLLYGGKCAFCGDAWRSAEGGANAVLSVAHIATTRRLENLSGSFSRPFLFQHVANTVLLCHDFPGSCHQAFDGGQVALIPDMMGQSWCIMSFSQAWHRSSQDGISFSHPDYAFDKMPWQVAPYRRALARKYARCLKVNTTLADNAMDLIDRSLMTKSSEVASEAGGAGEWPEHVQEFMMAEGGEHLDEDRGAAPKDVRGWWSYLTMPLTPDEQIGWVRAFQQWDADHNRWQSLVASRVARPS